MSELLFPIPDHWEPTTLGEACKRGGGDVQTGPFGSQLHAADYVPIGIPSIMPQNIGDNRISEIGIARITDADAKRLSRYLVQPGDIVYSRRGDVERRALIREREAGWLCGTGCLRVRFGDGVVHPPFAAFYLGHPIVREWIVRHAQGATMPNLNTSILSSLPFVLPSMDDQRAIAQILSELDDKIELNRRMNETLEAMARAIFQSWFVDFDPVRAKASGESVDAICQRLGLTPELLALFPDSFEDSELGEIPKGWVVEVLGDLASNPKRGIQPDKISPNTPYIALEHMPRRSIVLSDWGGGDGLESNKFEFQKGEILFGKLRPYFHKVGVAPLAGVCSTDILVVAPKSEVWFGVVLGHVSSVAFVEHTNAGSTGTKMPRTSWKEMSAYRIPLPTSAIAEQFSAQVLAILGRINSAIFESKSLGEMRDTLLPKLLSGELQVPSTEACQEGP